MISEGRQALPGAGEDLLQDQNTKENQFLKNATKKKGKKKLSREALSLMNSASAIIPTSERLPPDVGGPVKGSIAKGFAVPEVAATRKNPDGNVEVHMPVKTAVKADVSTKRTSGELDGLAAEVAGGSAPKKTRKEPNAQPQQQQQTNPASDAGAGRTTGPKSDGPNGWSARPDLQATRDTDVTREGQYEGAGGKPPSALAARRSSDGSDAKPANQLIPSDAMPARSRKSKSQAAASGQQDPQAVLSTKQNHGSLGNAGPQKETAGIEKPKSAGGPSEPAGKARPTGKPPADTTQETYHDSAGAGISQQGAKSQPVLDARKQAPAPAIGRPGVSEHAHGGAVASSPPAVQRRLDPPGAPKAAAEAAAAAQAPQQALGTSTGAGTSGSLGQDVQPAAYYAQLPDSATPAPHHLPATGTTPVKAFVPVPMPRVDAIGQRERQAVINLQRQLNEMRALYDELKATKIADLETILADQAKHSDEQIQQLEDKARLWQRVAEAAEEKARVAGSEETAKRIHDLEVQVEQLLREKAQLLCQVAQQSKEMALMQQAYHDLRAQLQGLKDAGLQKASQDGTMADQAPDSVKVASQQKVDSEEAGIPNGSVAQEAPGPSPNRTTSLATAAPPLEDGDRGVRAPTPSPGIGVQFPTPGIQLYHLQALLGNALAMPIPHSSFPGVSTECQRVVDMLPSLRAPSPSVDTSAPPGVPSTSVQAHSGAGGRASLGAAAVGFSPRQGQPLHDLPAITAAALAKAAATALPTSPLQSLLADRAGSQDLATLDSATEPSTRAGVSTEMKRIVQMLPSLRPPTPSANTPLQLTTAVATKLSGTATAAGRLASGCTPSPCGTTQQGPLAHIGKSGHSSGSPIDGICDGGQAKAAGTRMAEDLSFANGVGAPEAFQLSAQQQDQYSFVDLNPTSALKSGRPQQVLLLSHAAPAGGLAASRPEPQQAHAAPLSPPQRVTAPSGAGPVVNSGSVASNQVCSTGPVGFLARAMARHRELLMLPTASAALSSTPLRNPQERLAEGARAATPPSAGKQPVLSQGLPDGDRACSPLSVRKQPAPSPVGCQLQAGPTNSALNAQRSEPEVTAATRVGPPVEARPSNMPSPMAAKMLMFERMLGWNVNVLSMTPPTHRLIHIKSGIKIEVREDEVQVGESGKASDGGQPQDASLAVQYVTITPLQEPFPVEKRPPICLQCPVQIPISNLPVVLERVNGFISKETRGAS